MTLKLKILMMLKDEDDLAHSWIRYHGALIGYENLILLDNGSMSPPTLAALNWARAQGASVNASFSASGDFVNRGELYTATIRTLDEHGFADFWFPLDCDEFLSVHRDGRLFCDRDALERELTPYVGSPNPLLISAALNNHPLRAGCFRWGEQRKTFFAGGACGFLDHGFHVGESRQKLDALRTGIVYVHFHYKPFALLREHAKAKLVHYTDDFSREGLLAYQAAGRPSFHCVNHMLTTQQAYHDSFDAAEYFECREIVDAFEQSGDTLPFS